MAQKADFDPAAAALDYLNEEVPDAAAALAGAQDIIAEGISDDAACRAELRRYLMDFLQLEDSVSENARAAVSAAVIYFRYPMAAFLLAFTAVGAVLLPCVTVLYGCLLSFSVSCFTAAFGAEGTALALAVLGPRCLVSMPCYFLLASPAWGMSAARLPIGRGRRTAPVTCGREWWRLCGAVSLVLLVGVCVELVLTPRLAYLALRHILS